MYHMNAVTSRSSPSRASPDPFAFSARVTFREPQEDSATARTTQPTAMVVPAPDASFRHGWLKQRCDGRKVYAQFMLRNEFERFLRIYHPDRLADNAMKGFDEAMQNGLWPARERSWGKHQGNTELLVRIGFEDHDEACRIYNEESDPE